VSLNISDDSPDKEIRDTENLDESDMDMENEIRNGLHSSPVDPPIETQCEKGFE
jgi:hypothetical protein